MRGLLHSGGGISSWYARAEADRRGPIWCWCTAGAIGMVDGCAGCVVLFETGEGVCQQLHSMLQGLCVQGEVGALCYHCVVVFG